MWNSKPKKSGHNCRKASRHNPKVGGGICHIGMRAAVVARIRSKRLARLALACARAKAHDDFEG